MSVVDQDAAAAAGPGAEGGVGAVDAAGTVAWLGSFAVAVTQAKDHLTELDSAIGDGDHGANLDRGVRAVTAALGPGGTDLAASSDQPGAIAKAAGMVLIRTVGGASGPLLGTFFLRFATAAGTGTDLDGPTLAAALRAGVEGVAARGKSAVGDKTMLDALVPAVDALDAALAAGADLHAALGAAADAAEAGRDATVPLVAHKGRASYLGERSAGHPDPGATSSAMLVRAAVGTLA